MESPQGTPSVVRDSADVGRTRERRRQRRLLRIAVVLAPVAVFLWYRIAIGDPAGLPSLPVIDPLYLIVGVFFALMIVMLLAQVVVSGRSPHLVY